MRFLLLVAAAGASAACSGLAGDRAIVSSDFDKEASASDLRYREDAARTGLRRLEASLADYYKAEKRIPARIELLVPKYLAEVPVLNLPACGRERDDVEMYPADVLRAGQVDGSRIKGTGRWGYVYNDRQVIVFVDCTHKTSRSRAWYQERGVF